MKITKHIEGVYEIEEFLTIEEQEIFMSSCTDDGWIYYHPGTIVKDMTLEQITTINNILSRLNKFFDNMDSFTVVNNLRRLTKDERMWPHMDADPVSTKVIVFGISIYLNNDFTGGQLYYSDIGLSIEPKPRSIVIHNAKLSHEVKVITSGNRYSITAFVFGDNNTVFKYQQ